MRVTDARLRLAAKPGGARLLIGRLESGIVQPWIFEWRHRMGLVMSRDSELRARARSVLDAKSESRSEVLARYQSALDLKGGAQEGARAVTRPGVQEGASVRT